MPIEIPNVLSLIGGSPILKSGDVFINKLKAAKTLDGGSGDDDSGNPTGIAGLLSGIINGGSLSALMQNPVGAVSAFLQSTLTNSISQLTSALGGAATSLNTALTNLGTSVTSLNGLAATLSGASAGSPGPLDLITHSGLLEQFGSEVPAAVSFASASGPLTSADVLRIMTSEIIQMVSSVIAGNTAVADAVSLVTGLTTEVSSITAASNSAFSTMHAALIDLSALGAIGASSLNGSPELRMVMGMIMLPEVSATLFSSAAAMSPPAEIDQTVTTNWQFMNSQEFLDAIQEGADT